MTKLQFLLALHEKLSGLPKGEVEERLNFYSEMIEDRMEEGLSEADAVADIGSIDEIATQIIADIPITKIVKEKIHPKRRLKAWEIFLLALGAPVWLSLLIAAFAVMIALYVSLWASVISLWAVYAALIGGAICGVISGIRFASGGSIPHAIVMIGTALLSAGLAIFLFHGCRAAGKGAARLAGKMIRWMKNCFRRRERA